MADVFSILASALPSFEASSEDWKEGAPYFFLSDIRNFVCERANSGSVIEIKEFSALLETLVTDGDSEIQDMVRDSLEGLIECASKESIAKEFGPKTLHLWAALSKGIDDREAR